MLPRVPALQVRHHIKGWDAEVSHEFGRGGPTLGLAKNFKFATVRAMYDTVDKEAGLQYRRRWVFNHGCSDLCTCKGEERFEDKIKAGGGDGLLITWAPADEPLNPHAMRTFSGLDLRRICVLNPHPTLIPRRQEVKQARGRSKPEQAAKALNANVAPLNTFLVTLFVQPTGAPENKTGLFSSKK